MLTEPLTALLQRYPGLRFDIVSGGSERGVQLLARGDIDVAFGMQAAFSGWAQFKCEGVGGLEATPFVRRDHPILDMGPVRWETLVQFDFIVPSSSEPYTSLIQQMYEAQGLGVGLSDRLHVIDFFPLVRRIVASSDAIGVIAKSGINNRSFQNKFVALTGLSLFAVPPICCATRTRWPAKPAVRALISQCRRVYEPPA
jgi:DNA-binding transcriptional LysR family regulator